MKLVHRRIVLGFAVALFLIVSTVLVFYSMGFRFNFTENKIKEVGILDVVSFPKNVNVYIDDQLVKTTTPYQERDYFPKEYKIEIKKEGYTSWQKTLPVMSREITWAKNARIFLEKPEKKELLSNAIHAKISPNKNTLFAITKTGDNTITITSINTKNLETKDTLILPELLFNESNITIADISDNSESVIIKQEKDGRNHFFVTNLNQISEIQPNSNIDDLKFSTKNGDTGYYLSEKNLFKIDLQTQENQRTDQNVTLFSIVNQDVLYAKNENNNTSIMMRKNGTPLNFGNEQSKKQIDLPNSEIASIEANATGDIALIEKDGSLWIYNSENTSLEKIPEKFNKALFAKGSRKILLSNEKELYFYEIAKPEEQAFKQAYKINTLNLLTRYSSTIHETTWYADNAWALFHTNNSVKIIELDERDKRNIYEIQTQEARNLSINLKGDTLFYVDQNNNLISEQILEK